MTDLTLTKAPLSTYLLMQVSTPFKKLSERGFQLLNLFTGYIKDRYVPCPKGSKGEVEDLDPLINMIGYRLNFYMYRGTRPGAGGREREREQLSVSGHIFLSVTGRVCPSQHLCY